MKIATARLICILTILGEVLTGAFIYALERFHLIPIKPHPSYFKPIYYAGAGIVLILFIAKKILLSPSRLSRGREEELIPAISVNFVILISLASTISFLGIILYLLTASLKYSLIMVGVSIIASIMVFPFPMAVEGIVYEVKRRRETGPSPDSN